MISKRLVKLLDESKNHILLTVLWYWISLIANIIFIFRIAGFLELAYKKEITTGYGMQTALLLVLMILVRVGCDILAGKSSYRSSITVKKKLREMIYRKLVRIDNGYSSLISTSEVVQMASEGVEQLEIYFGKYLPQLFYSLLAPVTLFLVLSFISLKAAAVLLLCVPLIPISIIAVQKFAKKLVKKYWKTYTELGDSFLENLQGLTTLKIYQADGRKAEEMDQEAEQFRKVTMRVLTMQLNSVSVMDLIAYGGAAAGIIVAFLEFQYGVLSVAGALTILLLASDFFIPLRLLGSFFHIAMNGMAAGDKIFHLLEMEEKSEGKEAIEDFGREIRMEEVSFSYEENREILHRINISIPRGSFISLVGASGCGKSTVAALLTGKQKRYQGRIFIGNKELSVVADESIMQHITLVTHNSYLFKGTVEENLRMGKSEATMKEMEEALRKVNLYEFFMEQQGLKTVLKEKASNLSGGQCQRLSMARALLRDSEVYILDEATSNIDTESENHIMEAVRRLAETRTVILISHRLANVTASDCIYVLDKGIIKEAGKHKELLDKKGLYYKLYESQCQLEQYTARKEKVKEGAHCA